MIINAIYNIGGFKFLHVLRRIKFFLNSPIQFFKELLIDLKKDFNSKKKRPQIIWCAGIPKSGSTLIEEIFNETDYVDLSKTSLRWFNNYKLDNPHGISDQMFFYGYKNKLSFLKTHSHYSKKYYSIAKKYNIKIIVSLRDLRDALVSQVYHIKNDKKHWQNKHVKDLNFENSLIYLINSSFKINGKKTKVLMYYYNWIKDWKLVNEKNIIFVWYEDYLKNPNRYTKKILNFADNNQNNYKKILRKLKSKRNRDKNLTLFQKLYSLGREKSTFREGKMRYYKTYFTPKVEKEFLKIINKRKLKNVIYR